MDHFPLNWGKPRTDDDAWNPYPSGLLSGGKPGYYAAVPKTVTQQPIVTGTSVIAIKYRNGIAMAADCLGSVLSVANLLRSANL
ncbi:MAG: hypothetical protein BJ554DRAFT_1573 [Olpidium bornovanus]|uniref:Uncharacterized protein n=1 Tax=Olpidium bornovanus TaxID=278681 RepID=A0A8H7ZS44_9FUNG|nr:MAG: hypothetical protein BJ554DRAFT_1573 [Olpidium bornovanus]